MKIKDWLMDQQQDEPMSEDEEYTPPADGGDITTAVTGPRLLLALHQFGQR